jgi:hypothetical protein
MSWYVLKDGKWTPRTPLLIGRASYTPCLLDPKGEKIADVALRPVSWEDILPKADNVYLITRAVEKVKTFNDHLIKAKLAEYDTFIHIWVYCPNVGELPNETVAQRLVRFGNAVAAASRFKPDLFVGPEYFFTKSSNKLANPAFNHCYNQTERDEVENAVRGAGFNNRGLLIIPGTMLWIDNSKAVRNTTFIHCRNESLFMAHSKRAAHHDETYAGIAGGVWTPGATHFDFEFRGFRSRYQICKDMGSDPEAMKELHLLSGFQLGGGIVPRAHGGGWEVLSDGGTGTGRIEKTAPGGVVVPMTKPQNSDSFSLVVHIRKLAV